MTTATRHAPLLRLHDLVEMLQHRDGLTLRAIQKRLGVTERTAQRLIVAVQAAGYTLEVTYDEKRRKVYHVAQKPRLSGMGISTQTMAVLFLSRAIFGFLRGTGFKEELDEFFTRLERVISYEDLRASRSLDRKLFDYDEMPHVYEGRAEQIDVIMNGLLKEERVDLTHAALERGKRAVVFEIFTLLVYKKGLYLIGRQKDEEKIHRLALDEVIDVDRRRGDKFKYPKSYSPRAFLGEPFGIRRGKREKVVLRFRAAVAKYVRRRKIHSTQKLIDQDDGSLVVEMTPEGLDQLDSFVLEYRDNVEVLEPRAFREEIGRQIARMGAIYGLKVSP